MGKLEPISPVSPVHMDPDLDLVPARFSKEELIQNMDRVDREITMVEQQISKLRKKQVRTIDRSSKKTGTPPVCLTVYVCVCFHSNNWRKKRPSLMNRSDPSLLHPVRPSTAAWSRSSTTRTGSVGQSGVSGVRVGSVGSVEVNADSVLQ